MKLALIILVDALVLFLLFGHTLTRRFQSRARRRLGLLRDYERHLRHLLHRERDLMSAAQTQRLTTAIAEIRAGREAGADTLDDARLERMQAELVQSMTPRRHAWLREYLEVFVVALGLAFGVRGLYLQPFKIPTGSMEPTLFGIHFEELDEPMRRHAVQRFFDYVHHSRRHVDVVVRRAGRVESISRAKPAIPLFPATIIEIAGERYRLPGTEDAVLRYCPKIREFLRKPAGQRGDGLHYDEGEVLARGYLALGDHLFVNRTRLNFTEPKRGDVTVFLTDDIRDPDGGDLGGRYYIKRLVGLPGDELLIRDRKLHLRRPGDAAFTVVDGDVNPAFERLYGFRGGYRGYSHLPGSAFLDSESATFTVPSNHYFMLGDNSENSKDSRAWGTVPRRNLVGRAMLVWWPFSRRWGPIDRIEPLGFPSPPTQR